MPTIHPPVIAEDEPPVRRPRVADYLADSLSRLPVRHVFGVGGANIEDLYDAFSRTTTVSAIVAKHEFSAATMADGYARVSHRLGVVIATSGGGCLNLLPGLAEAHAGRTPLLALVGQPPGHLDGRGSFQDCSGRAGTFDARPLFSAVSRFCARVDDPSEVPSLLSHAVQKAGQGGPAVLLLPKDVQQAVLTDPPALADLLAIERPGPPTVDVSELATALLASLGRARDQHGAVGGVVIIAGDTVSRAQAREELAALARLLGAEVAVAPDARDVFDNDDPRFLGISGVMGHPGVERRLRRPGLCLLVGTRLPVMARGALEVQLAGRDVLALNVEPAFVRTDLEALTCDLRGALRALLEKLGSIRPPSTARGDSPGPVLRPPALTVPPRTAQRGLTYGDAVNAIRQEIPPQTDVVVDAGNCGASVAHHLPVPAGARFLIALGMGGMGYSFGAGIGAAFASGRRTYVIAGDGAFLMHGLEVHTAIEHDLPVTFVIFNNNAHAMCVTREQVYFGGDRSGNRFRPAQLGAGVAAMFPGLTAGQADSTDELRRFLRATNPSGSPAFVSIDCDPDELPPFVPFLPPQLETPNDVDLVHAG